MTGNVRKRITLVWTDDEVELLLRVTLDYKKAKLQHNVDWESCQTKYSDIMMAFQEQYQQASLDKDFPHHFISKAQVTAKIKSIRGKYRRAVETGRRSGQGRVVLIFHELCEEIWGGSKATRCLDAGIETGDLEEWSPTQNSTVEPDSPVETEPVERSPPPDVHQRRSMLQCKMKGRRKLTRKFSADQAVMEDIRIKRRMLDLMEESSRRNAETIQHISTNITNITHTIQEGFSLMRELLLQKTEAHPLGGEGGGEEGEELSQEHPPEYIKQEYELKLIGNG